MAVSRLPDGRWLVKWRDRDNRAAFRTRSFGRGPDAESRAREYNAALGFGQREPRQRQRAQSPTVESLAAEYLYIHGATMAASSVSALSYKLTGVILPALGHIRAVSLTRHRLDEYVAARARAGVKASTIHRELSDLQAILNWALRRGMISHNPVAGHRKPRRDNAIILPPSPAEVRAIMAHAPDHLRLALSISYYTGLRPGASELLRMRWEDIDLDGGTILVISARKGGPTSRRVPLHADLAAMLASLRPQSGSGYVITWRGLPVARLKRTWSAARRRAGIARRLRLYDLRHAFATSLLRSGAGIKEVSELIGHSRVDTTLRTYHHTTSDSHRQAVDSLESLIE